MIQFIVFVLACACVGMLIHLRAARQRMAELEQRLSRVEDDVHQRHFPETPPLSAPTRVRVPTAQALLPVGTTITGPIGERHPIDGKRGGGVRRVRRIRPALLANVITPRHDGRLG